MGEDKETWEWGVICYRFQGVSDGLSHIGCYICRVPDARAGPTVGVAVVNGAEVTIVWESRVVFGGLKDVAVKWAGKQLRGG